MACCWYGSRSAGRRPRFRGGYHETLSRMTSQLQQARSGTLFAAVIDSKNLLAAWEKVEENAGAPGVDGISIVVFGLTLGEELARLQKALRNHTYRPQPLLRVWMNKPHGGQRALAIPTVRDRVVQTAVALAITPILEAEFEEVSFGYRPRRARRKGRQRQRKGQSEKQEQEHHWLGRSAKR